LDLFERTEQRLLRALQRSEFNIHGLRRADLLRRWKRCCIDFEPEPATDETFICDFCPCLEAQNLGDQCFSLIGLEQNGLSTSVLAPLWMSSLAAHLIYTS
jgi:hypothetical protein